MMKQNHSMMKFDEEFDDDEFDNSFNDEIWLYIDFYEPYGNKACNSYC